jgi:hypothetical protein
MIAARIEAAKEAMPLIPEEQQARMPFRRKEQQLLLRKKSRMETALGDGWTRCVANTAGMHVRSWIDKPTVVVAATRDPGGW